MFKDNGFGGKYCSFCGEQRENEDDRECGYCGEPGYEEKPEAEEMQVTCNRCGFSGGLNAVKVHSCYVQENGGRCEDFPCCGHTDGDGCQTRPEHTSEYWSDMAQRNPDLFERYMNGDFDGMM